jgi:hypothetical protein
MPQPYHKPVKQHWQGRTPHPKLVRSPGASIITEWARPLTRGTTNGLTNTHSAETH